MAAYMICDVTVKDPARLRDYLRLSEATLATYGGRFLSQARPVTVIEGEWQPKVVILAEFPDRKAALDWYGSGDYAPALKVRPEALDRTMIVIGD